MKAKRVLGLGPVFLATGQGAFKAKVVLNSIGVVSLVCAGVLPQTIGAGQPLDIASGYYYTCLVTDAGGVNCIGKNSYGQLGDDSTEDRIDAYVRVVDSDDPTGFLTGAVAVSAGGEIDPTAGAHTCALIEGGDVKCWGSNGYGQLGDGSTASSSVAVKVVSALPMTSIVVGRQHTCAVTDPPGVQCWGKNNYGQLGDDTSDDYSPYPVEVNAFPYSDAVAVTAGRSFSCALNLEGRVKCWGSNAYGQLGRGTVDGMGSDPYPTPDFVVDPDDPYSPLSGVVAIDSMPGAQGVCAAMGDSGVKCWGSQPILLPDGTTEMSGFPVAVSDPDGLLIGAVDVTMNSPSGCAIIDNGGVKCWGYNGYGQLGDGSVDDYSLVPRSVQLLSNTLSISYGERNQVCAIGGPYGANCWGWNVFTPYSPISASNGEIEYIVWQDSINFPVEVIFDETPPTIVVDVEGSGGFYDWYTSDVTVDWSVTDDSLITSTSGCDDTVINTDTTGTTLTCTAEDSQGNESTESVTIKRDATPPLLLATASPAPNENGWNNTDVTVEFICTDATSGVYLEPLTPVVLSLEMEGIFAHGSCTDFALNQSGTLVYANIDKTAPTVSATASPAPNEDGWNNTDVTVVFSGTDNLSGIDSCSQSVLSAEGLNMSADGHCTDLAGNEGQAEYTGINIDKTAPIVEVTGVADGATYILGNVPVPGCDTKDALSGVRTEASLIVLGGDGDGTGVFTAICAGAFDRAGNPGSASVSFTIVSPQEATESFIKEIDELSNLGILNDGLAASLIEKLEVVVISLDREQPRVAANLLKAFIREVNALTAGGLISDEQGAMLINAAEAILTAISPRSARPGN